MTFNFKTNIQHFKQYLENISYFVEECQLIFTDDGIRVATLCDNKIAFIESVISKDAFEVYEFEGDLDVCIKIKDVLSVFKSTKPHNYVQVSLTEDNLNALVFVITEKNKKRRRKNQVKMIDLDIDDDMGSREDFEDNEFCMNIDIKAETFCEVISIASNYSEKTGFALKDDQKISVSSFDDMGSGCTNELYVEDKDDILGSSIKLDFKEQEEYSIRFQTKELHSIARSLKTAACIEMILFEDDNGDIYSEKGIFKFQCSENQITTFIAMAAALEEEDY